MSSMTVTTSSAVFVTPSTYVSQKPPYSADPHRSWEKAHYLSLTLWDIEREFQKSYEAYEQWRTKTRRKKSSNWMYFKSRKLEDKLAKMLRLGRQVRALLEKGIEEFGARFEQGDSTCHSILCAQLLRVQHEIRVPIEDCAHARFSITLPRDELLTAAKGVRRACLLALRDQYSRFATPTSTPFLPPPRFSVNFCPFACELQKDPKKANDFQSYKVRRHDRYDEREICPHCAAHIAVTMHTGLPAYRQLLFQSHLRPALGSESRQATFACTSCYKTFEDSYGFLDHILQKEIGSERSCQKRWSTQWHFNQYLLESDPGLVDKCLRNCLKRELMRSRGLQNLLPKAKVLESLVEGQKTTSLVFRPKA